MSGIWAQSVAQVASLRGQISGTGCLDLRSANADERAGIIVAGRQNFDPTIVDFGYLQVEAGCGEADDQLIHVCVDESPDANWFQW